MPGAYIRFRVFYFVLGFFDSGIGPGPVGSDRALARYIDLCRFVVISAKSVELSKLMWN